MKLHRVALVCALGFVGMSAFAQTPEMPAAAPASATAPAAAQDCVKPHDHGAERQVPTPSKGCKPAGKVANSKAQAAKTKAIEGHDHGKVHKNQ